MYEIRQVRMDDGEVLYLLADVATGLPDAHVLRHIIVDLRPSGASSGSLHNRVRGIRRGLTLLREADIDIEQRISSGRFLDAEELHGLAQRCVQRVDGTGRIDGRVAGHYYTSFIEFVAFRVGEVLQFAPEDGHAAIVNALEHFRKRASRHRPRASQGADANERLGLEPDLRSFLLRVIQPGDPDNPFQRCLQIRNHAMILLTYELGLRSGEEFSLKRQDYDDRSDAATITIHRRPDDVDETRKEPALVKTLGRILPVEGLTRIAIDAWLKERSNRLRYPLARTNPYIFVARSGKPLSLRRARQIYEDLRRVYPELGPLVQHIIRHDVNDRWTEHDELCGNNPDTSDRERKYAMGWSDDSRMPSKYGKASIRRSAAKRISDRQKDALGKDGH